MLSKYPWGFRSVEQASDGGQGASVKKSLYAKFRHSKCHGEIGGRHCRLRLAHKETRSLLPLAPKRRQSGH